MSQTTSSIAPVSRTLLVAAFAAIYIVWGSTYLAIRVVVETLPPFLSAGVRFVLAGGALMLLLAARGTALPRGHQWKTAAVTGLLLLLGGNGLVVWAEQSLSSGFTAVLVALAPIWFALLDWARPHGVRPEAKTVVGIVIGFAGVVMLVNGGGAAASDSGSIDWLGVFAILIAGVSWAGGSLYSRHKPQTESPWMNSAAQMLCGGIGLLATGTLAGEPFRTDWSAISSRSVAALGYLIVFGSWIAFSAYVWLLKASTPGKVSTYAYVNPVIAVLLGGLILGERLAPQMLWGAAVIVLGVAVITVKPARITPGRWLRAVTSVVMGK